MTSRLDREIVLKTLRGYAIVNQITEAERRARLKTMTDAEAREIFDSLYDTWKRTGKQAGGDWEALARRELEDKIRVRRAFEALARRRGLM
jgi:hypothetical protein